MERYERYKDSGVEWIGEIPGHWGIKKVSYSFDLIGSGTTPDAGLPEYYLDATINWVNTGDLNDGILNSCNKKVTRVAFEKFSALKLYPIGSLLIAMYGATIGKVAILNIEACTNQACCSLSGSNIFNIKYVFYWFLANKQHIVNLSYGGGQPNISQETIKSLRIPCPQPEEQTAIANFLDGKTVQIDQHVAKKQRLIELLKEERTAIINNAVTRGVDTNAKLKPSGIEWLGDIPEHWEVTPMTKYLQSIVDYRGKTPTKSDTGIFLVTARNIKNGEINYSLSEEYILEEEYESTMRRGELEIGDVLFTTEAPLGEAANVDRIDVAVAQRIIKFRGKKGLLNNYYLKHWIMSPMFQQDLYSYSTGSTAIGIKASKLFNLKLLLPPISEQMQIVDYISSQICRFKETISKIQKEIELLQEYRTALISEVVTGKVKVI